MAASADARSQPKSPAGCNFLMYEQAHGPYPHVEQRSDGTAELPVGVIAHISIRLRRGLVRVRLGPQGAVRGDDRIRARLAHAVAVPDRCAAGLAPMREVRVRCGGMGFVVSPSYFTLTLPVLYCPVPSRCQY